MTRIFGRRLAPLLAAHLIYIGALSTPLPALAMQILDAADHAELAAEISATDVNRIALAGDRIAKAVRAPDGFAVEHDAASGDLYLRPLADAMRDPVTLFVGTEKGFTYRLTLTPAMRGSAQILIRNADTVPGAAAETVAAGAAVSGDPHIARLVGVVRAVARRDLLPGYEIHTGERAAQAGLTLIETWRGPRFAALVFEATGPASNGADGIAGLAGTIGALPGVGRTGDGARLAALWLAAPGTGPSGGRLGVAVTEAVPAGERR